MLHNEARKLFIEAWNKTHNAKKIAECFPLIPVPFTAWKKGTGKRLRGNKNFPAWAKTSLESN